LDKTFARIRRQQRQQEERVTQAAGESLAKVTSIVRKTVR
jgi:hypothetical protein